MDQCKTFCAVLKFLEKQGLFFPKCSCYPSVTHINYIPNFEEEEVAGKCSSNAKTTTLTFST